MQEIRYIQNPFNKIFSIVNPDRTQLYNLLLKLLTQFLQQIKLPTLNARSSIIEKSSQDLSVYTGSGGYLYLLIKLVRFFSKREEKDISVFIEKSFIVGDEGVSKLTDPFYYIKLAQEQYKALERHVFQHKRDKTCFSFFISQASIWLCGMHLGFLTRKIDIFRQNQQRIFECYENLLKNIDKVYWQLLYGVPGFVYVLLEIQKYYDKCQQQLFKTDFSSRIIHLVKQIIKHGIKNYQNLSKVKIDVNKIPQDFRLVYYFHKSQYLGGAHGLGGNLSIILSALKMNDFGPQLNNILVYLKSSVTFLLRNLINGNYPTRAGSQNTKLVHFCHGAPGIVIALAKFMQLFPQMGIMMGINEVIQRNLDHIWNYGVLKKGFGLCHGISGNAYGFISPSITNILGQRKKQYLKKAQFFCLLHEQKDVMKEIREYQFKDRLVVGKSDQPYSFMVGIAGDIYFTLDVIQGQGYYPGYDL